MISINKGSVHRLVSRTIATVTLLSMCMVGSVLAQEEVVADVGTPTTPFTGNFGRIVVGSESDAEQNRLCAHNLAPGHSITVTDTTLVGANPSDFAILSNGCANFVFTRNGCANQACLVTLAFQPIEPGKLKSVLKYTTTANVSTAAPLRHRWHNRFTT
jgi:hypothetical protein